VSVFRDVFLRYLTDVGSAVAKSTVGSGRLCFLFWDDYYWNGGRCTPRDAEFLRECFPKDSVFFAHAYSWMGTQDCYVTWRVAVVAPNAEDEPGWQSVWKQVNRAIGIGYFNDASAVGVIEPGREEAALEEYAVMVGKKPTGYVTGSVSAVKDALSALARQ
jgi:hypothetical protein